MASGDFLRLIERSGLTGTWSWVLATGEEIWSPGFYRLLGLKPRDVRASYEVFTRLVHPEDRGRLATAGEILHGHAPREGSVRVIRPDGSTRVLSLVAETRCSPEGRPLAMTGLALDVTDRDRLAQLHGVAQRRRQSLYLTRHVATFSVGLDLIHDFPEEMARVHGPSLAEIKEDPFVMVVPEERAAFRERAWDLHDRHLNFQGKAHERLANGEVWCFRIIGVPLFDEQGGYLGRSGLKYPDRHPDPRAAMDGRLRLGLEQAVRGYHLRAARALLDWPMAALAQASGLSLSTVRRLEEDGEVQGVRSRHKAVDALRLAGIRFIALDDGTIAIARR